MEEIQEESFKRTEVSMLGKIKNFTLNTIPSMQKNNADVETYDIDDIAKQLSKVDMNELEKIKNEVDQLKKGLFIK